MSGIKSIRQQTSNRFLNCFELEAVHRDGGVSPYYVASRAKNISALKAVTHENNPDGVILYGIYGKQRDRVVLIRQYRYPLGDYLYEFPAGLVEDGEEMTQAGIREMFEETGLTFTPVEAGSFSRPFFTTAGIVRFGIADGEKRWGNFSLLYHSPKYPLVQIETIGHEIEFSTPYFSKFPIG